MRITQYNLILENYIPVLIKKKSNNYDSNNIKKPQQVVTLLNDLIHLNRQAEEYVYLVAFNTQLRPLGIFEISHGTVNSSSCSPREIFIRALLCGATAILLAHNHPSGNPQPSEEDKQVYKRIRECGDLLNIALLDFIIIGEDSYISFRN